MSNQITKQHLQFVQEAKEAFENNNLQETYRNEDDSLIALRMGMDRDCVMVYELGDEVANFVQQMDPRPKPRKVVYQFAYDMEEQLRINEYRGGWINEHYEYLSRQLFTNLVDLDKQLKKIDIDKDEITIRCANIANFAMMIADNYGNVKGDK